jgi:hypothetical protein
MSGPVPDERAVRAVRGVARVRERPRRVDVPRSGQNRRIR